MEWSATRSLGSFFCCEIYFVRKTFSLFVYAILFLFWGVFNAAFMEWRILYRWNKRKIFLLSADWHQKKKQTQASYEEICIVCCKRGLQMSDVRNNKAGCVIYMRGFETFLSDRRDFRKIIRPFLWSLFALQFQNRENPIV